MNDAVQESSAEVILVWVPRLCRLLADEPDATWSSLSVHDLLQRHDWPFLKFSAALFRHELVEALDEIDCEAPLFYWPLRDLIEMVQSVTDLDREVA